MDVHLDDIQRDALQASTRRQFLATAGYGLGIAALGHLLANDGCAGIAVLNPHRPQEVQFDEHKILIVYGSPLERFEAILERRGVPCNEQMRFITEAEHVHSSSERYFRQFDELKTKLGMDVEYDLH